MITIRKYRRYRVPSPLSPLCRRRHQGEVPRRLHALSVKPAWELFRHAIVERMRQWLPQEFIIQKCGEGIVAGWLKERVWDVKAILCYHQDLIDCTGVLMTHVVWGFFISTHFEELAHDGSEAVRSRSFERCPAILPPKQNTTKKRTRGKKCKNKRYSSKTASKDNIKNKYTLFNCIGTMKWTCIFFPSTKGQNCHSHIRPLLLGQPPRRWEVLQCRGDRLLRRIWAKYGRSSTSDKRIGIETERARCNEE